MNRCEVPLRCRTGKKILRPLTTEKIQTIRKQLLRWYRRCGRDLPWRRNQDAYSVWVSEIMLQQTRVTAVQPYYERFLKRFPRLETLARAKLDSVLKVWEGLGYYSRARNLHKAASVIMKDYNGRLPETVEELQALPGIGRYTAGAIASIAFGLPEPVLDGNVTRVLCRTLRIRKDPQDTNVQKKLWRTAGRIIAPGKAGALNQGLMELGAMVCLPKRPRCERCPLEMLCSARQHGDEEQLPVRRDKKPQPHYQVAVGIVRKAGWILIDQRNPDGMLGGMWEFPGGKQHKKETLKQTVEREIREELGVRVLAEEMLTKVEHGYSHFRVTLHVFDCRYVSGKPTAIGCAAWKWVRANDLKRYAFPRGSQKIIEKVFGT